MIYKIALPLYLMALTIVPKPIFAEMQTQLQLNQQAADSYRLAERRMDGVYQGILERYKTDTEFIQNLRQSQRAWLNYRDAEMKAIYPQRQAGYYGSMHPTCDSRELTVLTENRTKELERWTRARADGDACAGSAR